MEENGHKNQNQSNRNQSSGSSFVDTSKADRAVWLLKCPNVVSRSFKTNLNSSSSDSASTPLVAKVIVSVDPLRNNDDDDSSPQFTMELAGHTSGDTPKRYSMNMFKDFLPMSVFSESSQGKIALEGKVLNKFDMKPHDDNIESYGKLCRERTKKYMTKNRQIKVLDDDKGINMRPMPGMSSFIVSGFVVLTTTLSLDKKKLPVKSSETKRTRRNRGEMEAIMFKLFERQPYWTLRQLIHETDQPEQFLKDILKDLCVYNNKGANQGSYEIKPEYKRTNEDQK
ncbi:TFIIF beta subunit, HTH domain [Dillenia turbinata]|uniref:TFIIF beta subunit, HTH domain n=1 Tax=Dillenia turbinata TaxID=194707 RepID=A0AAN8VGU6_9MAGN